jgi:flavin reductase (DIM6/NTAB) family NADH-FMN oxidoreductase RutF
MAVSTDEFRRACGRFATGVVIAAVLDQTGAPHGLTVSSFTSVSLHPPLVLICLGHAVTNIEEFRHATHFGLSILGAGERRISERFAQKGHDRFEGVEWRRGETGVPLLVTALATLECAVHQRFASGDHDILVGEVVRAHASEGEPLVHFSSHYRKLALD